MKVWFANFVLVFLCYTNLFAQITQVQFKHVEIHIDSVKITPPVLYGWAIADIQSMNSDFLIYLCLKLDSAYEIFSGTSVTIDSVDECTWRLTNINQPGDYKIKFWFHGKPPLDPQGFGGVYFINPYVFNLGVSLNLPVHSFGRAWFPTTDEFTDKATYSFYIRTDTSLMAICNGTLQSVTPVPGTPHQIWHWKLRDSIPAYLVSFAIGPYKKYTDQYISITNDTIPIEIYVPQNLLSKVAGTFAHLHQGLSLFEEKFGPYRWERIGYVGVPFNAGAMEHATSIAIPNLIITGNTSYETLIIHELSHHWFGNLVTCKTPQEMWLNEGWARYSEYIFLENIYNLQQARQWYMEELASTLKEAHLEDGGFYPVGNIPLNITYGSTTYDKGALVLHTLRNYLGDSLFFESVRQYTQQFSFANAGNEDFKQVLENVSQMNLNDFFDGWVYTKGFPHFDAHLLSSFPAGNGYVANVRLKQKLYGADHYWKGNKIELVFYDSTFNHTSKIANFSSIDTVIQFNLPFKPAFVWLDPEEKTADACVGESFQINNPGTYIPYSAYCNLTISSIMSPFLLRIEHHIAAPDSALLADTIYRLSPNHYWKVTGLVPNGTVGTLHFQYIRNHSFHDKSLLITSNSADSLVLVYRSNINDPWKIIPFVKSGNNSIGYLKTSHIAPGEYAFAIGKPFQSYTQESTLNAKFKIYPNPGKNFILECYDTDVNIEKISIFSVTGQELDVIHHPTFPYYYAAPFLPGVYIMHFIGKDGNVISSHFFSIIRD
ncbi:MAG: M1 family aminopeptidase [Bacteroidales bacterium]|nr:M1 family aminopeptidase [Bacteroidales bacterium]